MNIVPERPPPLQVRLLGGFRAIRDGSPVAALDSGRVSSLLAYLLFHQAAPVSRQQLSYTLWPDTSDRQARANLRTLLSRLRSALGNADDFLSVTHQTIRLQEGAPLIVDLFQFEQYLSEADHTAGDVEKIDCLEQAVSFYRGDLLPDCYDDWIAPERERRRSDYLQGLEALILLHEEQRSYEDAIRYGQRLLRTDPLHEATYRRLMRLHALNGDRAGALRVYHVCVDSLKRELDVEPGAKTQETYRRLLNRDAGVASEISPGRSPLVGRDREWLSLTGAWQRANRGKRCIVALTGDAGIGKTRLAEEMVAWAERQGITTAVAHCYATAGELAYGPITQWLQAEGIREFWSDLDDIWLSELARILPQLLADRPAMKAPDPLSARWQRLRLFEALARALLAGGRPLLLLIDDLQWSDSESLDWLHYLLQFDARQPLLIMATVRLADVADDHRYRPFRLTLQQSDHLDEIQLDPLDAEKTAILAGGLSGKTLTPGEATNLFRETEGNPLFVVETVQAGETAQRPEPAKESGDPSLSPKVAAVLQQRLAQLSPSTQQVMGLAAVLGRAFTFDTLADICEQDEDAVVNALDEAWRRRIIREQGANAYDFSHDKLRTVAYAQISPMRRRYLHRRTASVLAAQQAGQETGQQTGQTDDACIQIAHHFLEAGDPVQAAHHLHRAVDVASRRYAIESLISASTKALDLLHELDPQRRDGANQTTQAAIIDERMWSWEMVGDMDAYLSDLENLNSISLALGDEALLNRESRLHAAALIRLGRYREAEEMALACARRYRAIGSAEEEGICQTIVGRARRELGEHGDAITAFEQALVLLNQANAFVYEIQAYSYLSTTFWQMGDYAGALSCGEQALAICQRESMPQRKRFALGDMGAAAAMLGREQQARQWLTESLDLAHEVTDTTQEAFCLGHLGRLALTSGDLEEAEHTLTAAYELSQSADLINYASWLLRGLSETATAQGQTEKAHRLASKALTIARSNHQQMEAQAARRLLKRI